MSTVQTRTRIRAAARIQRAPRQRYMVMPAQGFRSPGLLRHNLVSPALGHAMSMRLAAFGASPGDPLAGDANLEILASAHEDGVKLIEVTDAGLQALKLTSPELRILPLVYYQLARRPWLALSPTAKQQFHPSAKPGKITLKLQDASGGAVADARVIVFTNLANSEGFEADSDAQGRVRMTGPAAGIRAQLLLIFPRRDHWSLRATDQLLRDGDQIALRPITLAQPDLLMRTYGSLAVTAGTGVRVGIIDSGVDYQHPDLRVAGGQVFTADDPGNPDFGPVPAEGGDHGTHVAGIVAGQLVAGGRRGVAPMAELRSYRVFPATMLASNFDITRAIDRAVEDGCDLVNLSLGGGPPDEGVRNAMSDALDAGTLCFIAAGNDGRKNVSYPARWSEAVAVSALGLRGSYPADSSATGDEAAPYSTVQPQLYLARFSNQGPAIDVTGPGVGIISTVPGGYADMSGTSMACPAVTGYAAALLSQDATLLAAPRDRTRAEGIRSLLLSSAKTLGMPQDCQGLGLPCPVLSA